jgi:hypothetical protein
MRMHAGSYLHENLPAFFADSDDLAAAMAYLRCGGGGGGGGDLAGLGGGTVLSGSERALSSDSDRQRASLSPNRIGIEQHRQSPLSFVTVEELSSDCQRARFLCRFVSGAPCRRRNGWDGVSWMSWD